MTEFKMFQVGGCVRDELLGVPSKDIDFAVEAPSFDAMQTFLEGRLSKVFEVKPEHFTLRGLDSVLGPVDFVLCRKDGPTKDGRRPQFVEPGTILDDLARRDFTVNAMAKDDDGTLLDPFGGQRDLADRMLRFVGKAEDRLADDALRAFRGVRFQVTKGFTLDDESRAAIQMMTNDQFDAVSTNRMRDEMFRCFAKDTEASLRAFCVEFPNLLRLALDRGLWLKPTLEEA